jgi:hypothetical protein
MMRGRNRSELDDERASLAPPFAGPHQSRATLAGNSASSKTR